MVTPAVSVQSVTHVRDDDSDDPALSIHPSLELGLDPPQVVRPLSSPDKKSTGGLPLGPGIWTRLSPVAEAVSNRSHSGTSSKASGKFSYPSTPLHGLVTVGVADDLRTLGWFVCMSPSVVSIMSTCMTVASIYPVPCQDSTRILWANCRGQERAVLPCLQRHRPQGLR